jgi:hypothetical protein
MFKLVNPATGNVISSFSTHGDAVKYGRQMSVDMACNLEIDCEEGIDLLCHSDHV